jgi:hypothetical protein
VEPDQQVAPIFYSLCAIHQNTVARWRPCFRDSKGLALSGIRALYIGWYLAE